MMVLAYVGTFYFIIKIPRPPRSTLFPYTTPFRSNPAIAVTRSTSGNSGPGGSGAATKNYVDMNIAITPHTATNEVGQHHVFTVTVTKFPAGVAAGTVNITPIVIPAPSWQITT